MKRSDTKIHQIELLLTLDYLLNYTDIDHPATQQDICRHARDFGLKYDPKANAGNDVRRQRIGDCLQFLQYVCYKFQDTDKIPFVINSTDSGKFYVEEKNHLNEEQIIKILAAVKNDKYTKDEDGEFLIERLLDSLSNKYNRDFYKNELAKENKNVHKYQKDVKRKINLVNKAYREGKLIAIYKVRIKDIFRKPNEPFAPYEPGDYKHYRVYKIKEYNNKPYAILIPVDGRGVLCNAIENLNLPAHLSAKEILTTDPEDNRNLDLLFKENSLFGRYYDSLDDYIEKAVMPKGGFTYKTSFYFPLTGLTSVKKSFEEYFSIEMPVILSARFKVDKEAGKSIGNIFPRVPRKYDRYGIIPNEDIEGKHLLYGVVNISINQFAFISWLYENPNIARYVTVVSPSYINKILGERFLDLFCEYKSELSDEQINKAFKRADRIAEFRRNHY